MIVWSIKRTTGSRPTRPSSARTSYAEPAAFHHAFRRWTDQTPQQWRAARSA